jgi:hypothetical protein
MKPNNAHKLILMSLTLLIALACNGTFTTGFPTPTSPSPSLPSAATPTSVGFGFVISALNVNETGENAAYTIDAQIPAILDNKDPHALAFNSEMQTIVQGEIDIFKKGVAETTRDPASRAGSLDGKYDLLFQSGTLVSIKLTFVGDTGGAHPYIDILTVNYDLAQSRQVALSDLFLPNSNYLEAISNYCITELGKQPGFTGPFQDGARPTPENYRNWNITREGVLITFGAYQVMPGASGPITVLVPYNELQAVINPAGPLAGMIP